MARTVLLADDSVTAQNMGRRILMDAGYEVITVNNGSAALKKIHESKPDLIVLDVYMPGYGGLEVCQRLKESEETHKIPVLLTVGKMEPFKTDEAKRVRADAHIVKPFDASELLAALTKLEDRIVPSSDGRGKGKTKKTRMWHSQDPATTFDDSNTEQIAYLAEVKKRQTDSPRTDEPEPFNRPAGVEPPPVIATTPEARHAAEIPIAEQESSEAATLASAPVETPAAEIAAPEFSVQEAESQDFESDAPIPTEPSPTESTPADSASTSSLEVSPVVETQSRWIAENVALSAEEASLELEREMHAVQAATNLSSTAEAHAEQQPNLSESSVSSETVTEQPSPDAAGLAFAAAAAAGTPTTGVSVPTSTDEAPVASEAAAAWENWQHIRESVMAPQTTAALAETVAEMVQAPAPAISDAAATSDQVSVAPELLKAVETASEAQSGEINSAQEAAQSSSSDSSSLEGDALASIVDSVLAELKPKLMQEIAKKLKK